MCISIQNFDLINLIVVNQNLHYLDRQSSLLKIKSQYVPSVISACQNNQYQSTVNIS